jgi:TP901 family phage tail tape measure protein
MANDVVLSITARDLATRVLNEVRGELRQFERAAGETRSALSGIGDALRGVAMGVGMAFGAAAVGAVASFGAALRESVGVAAQFEAGLLRFQAVAGDSLAAAGASLADVQALALELGSATQYSAAEALDALTELVKGGVSVADAMGGATEATLQLAAAGELGLANAAEIVAKQLGVWSATGVTAAQVADLLAGAANASTVGVEELALGLANVGGSARVAGVSFEETVQTLALIAPAFQSASDAGTSLKTFIARLVPQTKDATKAMIELGLATEDGKSKFFDAQGEFIGMEQAAALLQNALKGLSEEQKITALNTIFGSDAIRAAAMIAEAGASGFTAMGQAMAATGGAAASAAQMQQGYTYALEELSGAWETLQIVVGTMALPMLTESANRMRDGIVAVTQFVQAVQAGADPLLLLTQQLGLTGQQAEALRASVDAAGAGVTAALTLLQSTAQAALSAISAWWRQHGDEVLATAQTAWTTIQQAVGAALGALQSVIAAVIGAIGALWQRYGAELTAAAQTAWSDIQRIVTAALGIIQSIISATMSAIGAFWQAHGQTIIAGAQAAWQAIAAIVEGALRLIAGIIGGALAAIRGIMEGINAALRGDWQGAWNAIVSATTDVIGRIGNAISSGGPLIVSAFQAIGQAIQNAWNGLVGGAAGLGSALIDGIRSGVTRAAQSLARAVADAAWQALQAAKSALGIQSPSRVAADLIGLPIAQGIAQGMQRSEGLVARQGVGLAQAAMRGMASSTSVTMTNNITVNEAQAMDGETLAQRIRQELDRVARQALFTRG